MNIIISLLVVIYLLIEATVYIRIYQQNQYYIKRYFTSIKRNENYNSIFKLLILATIIFSNIILVAICLINFVFYTLFLVRKEYKVKFKFTSRMKRLAAVYFIIICSVYFMPMYAKMVILLGSPLLLVASHYLIMPLEKYFKMVFINNAKSKLSSINPIVIGITGSYGKTSSKNILNDILKNSKYTLATPASYNTPMGISITINNDLSPLNEVFIAEMGAYKIGEIAENCYIAKPDIAIITSIGTAHLESFGSRENILKGKFEIVENLSVGGLAILNADDSYMMSYEIKNKCKVLTYSIDAESDLKASNIVVSKSGVSFDISIDNEVYNVKSCLLGKHNIYNILASILVARYLNVSIDEIIKSVSVVKQISHRLELKEQNGFTIIDDAFNSNPVGAKEAVSILSAMDGYKVVITPGMIELGDMEYELNKQFGIDIASKVDYAIIVGQKRSIPFVEAFNECSFDKYVIVDSFDEGYKVFSGINEANKFLLIENDLPDIY